MTCVAGSTSSHGPLWTLSLGSHEREAQDLRIPLDRCMRMSPANHGSTYQPDWILGLMLSSNALSPLSPPPSS